MYSFSSHSIEQLAKRNITQEMALWVINNASEKIIDGDTTIYQSLIIEQQKKYLVRIFVNENKIPPLIITGYKTSKIEKY